MNNRTMCLDEVSTGSGSDLVTRETRSLPLPVLTSPKQQQLRIGNNK